MTTFIGIESPIIQLFQPDEVTGEVANAVSPFAPTFRILGTITSGDRDDYQIDLSRIGRLPPSTQIVFDVDFASNGNANTDLFLVAYDPTTGIANFDDGAADPGSTDQNNFAGQTFDPYGIVPFGAVGQAPLALLDFYIRGYNEDDTASYTLNVTFLNDNLRFGSDFADFLVSGGPGAIIFGFDASDILMLDGTDGGMLWGGGGFDTLLGADGADTAAGDEGSDRIDGMAGNDSLTGDAGSDRLYGGAGNDSLNGGSDYDYLNGGEGDDAISDIAESNTSRLDTLAGGEGADTLVGGFDFYQGGEGNDLLRIATLFFEDSIVSGAKLFGGDGNDRLEIIGAASDGADVVAFGRALSLVTTGSGWTLSDSAGLLATIREVESIFMTGSTGDDTLEGGAGGDSLFGFDGSDFLSGGAGNDTLRGADFLLMASRDTMLGGTGNDLVFATNTAEVFGDAGNDTLIGSGAPSRLDGGSGTDFLSGDVAGTEYFGGSGADTISIARSSTAASNGLGFPAAGAIQGGSGNDLLVLDLTGEFQVTMRTLGADGRLLLTGGGFAYTVIEGMERMQVSGTGLSFLDIKGLAGGDTLDGSGSAQSFLNGFGGNDSLMGAAGNDVLVGGTGNDTMNGQGGNDVYDVNSTRDVIIELAGGGQDTVSTAMNNYTLPDEIEGLTLSTFNLGGGTVLRGSGNGGANIMRIDGGAVATSAAGHLIGGGGADTLIGAATNDTLQGGQGNDVLTGGAGNDAFRFVSTTDRTDTILDFQAGQDRLEFLGTGFGNIAPGTDLGAAGRFISNTSGNANAPLAQFIFETDTSRLYFDPDGTGNGGKFLMATLDGITSLSASSITIIA